MEFLQNISQAEIAIAIATIPLVVKGITSKFKIEGSNQKEIIALIVSIGAFIYLMYKDNSIVQTVALFIMLYAGGTGIYNFIPKSHQDIEYIEIEDEDFLNEFSEELEE